WLILGYLDGGVRVTRTLEAGAVRRAADWIGGFPAYHEQGPPSAARSLRHPYHAGHYKRRGHTTDLFAGPLHPEFACVTPLCQRFEKLVEWVLALPPTVIHGEYYPANNILYSDRVIYPIDWESAAIGLGEIDLATLTEGWPPRVVRQCERRYQRARWP